MPKERLHGTDVTVGWGDFGVVEVGLFSEEFVFVGDDEVCDSLWITMNEEELDELIKVLKKARRKTFNGR